uniref:Protein regulator of cytokinesis 1 n=2 Tax=Panagrellus redivivus TaxID=6233 RepID=A0A7E4V7T1_PANRE
MTAEGNDLEAAGFDRPPLARRPQPPNLGDPPEARGTAFKFFETARVAQPFLPRSLFTFYRSLQQYSLHRNPHQRPHRQQVPPRVSAMASQRRMSIVDFEQRVLAAVRHAKEEFTKIWDEIGLPEDIATDRLQTTETIMVNSLKEMIDFEQNQLQRVRRSLDTTTAEMRALEAELCFPAEDPASLPDSMYLKVMRFRDRVKKLKADKEARMEEQLEVLAKYKKVYERLGWTVELPEDAETKIAAPSALAEWRHQWREAEKMLDSRRSKAIESMEEVKRIVAVMGSSHLTPEEVTIFSADYTSEATNFSDPDMEALEAFVNRAHHEYEQWLQKIRTEYNNLMVLVHDLRTKCGVEENEHVLPIIFNPITQDASAIQAAREEYAHLQKVYDDHQVIFDKFHQWHSLWSEWNELELLLKDYNNRGGTLNQRLARQKVLKSLIPKTQAELQELCSNQENLPMINGLTPFQRAEKIMREYEEAKEAEKASKTQLKQKQLLHESKFGCSPTPTRRPITKVRLGSASVQKTPRSTKFNTSRTGATPVAVPKTPMTSSPKGSQAAPPCFSPAMSSICPPASPRKTPMSTPKPWR